MSLKIPKKYNSRKKRLRRVVKHLRSIAEILKELAEIIETEESQ